MKAASVNDIKKELKELDAQRLRELCLRMARFRKENKELLTYLLYEEQDEASYVSSVKDLMSVEFETLPRGVNSYYIKKSLRKILRIANRFIKYSENKQTELDLRLFFCLKVKECKVPLYGGTVLYNIYQQQLKKIEKLFEQLDEDLRADYEREVLAAKRV